MLNKHNTVLARRGPLYATNVFLSSALSDFDTNDLVIVPIVLNNLTTNDLKIFADDGFDLSYIVIN